MEMKLDFLTLALAALVPLVVGMIWYSKMLFGKAWMQSVNMTEEDGKGMNMPLVFGLVYLFSFFMCMAIQFMVIHQYSIFSILANDSGIKDMNSEVQVWLKDFFGKYGSEFRTFKHGAFHGIIGGIMMALPITAVAALFERRGAKYIFIQTGYWVVCMALMGGIICQFAKAY